ncbi:sulfatase [Thalassotalea fonticola]|uniref:Sulfatase n=1 Tax=Thalassotalea fonticola TaxID=3065649 RepID=A0ABZ0GML4_9GAMM|nr:sulfatase [Colwelliaceae bacterium S1-1]
MKKLLIPLVASLALSHAVSQTAQAHGQAETAKTKQPNIVFIMLDDWGWQDVGYMGSEYYQSPNIDKLAENSYRFNQAYSASPNCAPTRAAFMSGQYSQRTGIFTVNSSARGKPQKRRLVPTQNTKVLADDVVTLGESMQNAGYHTAFMGKWHLGAGDEGGPLVQGFDVNVAGNHTGTPKSYFSPYKNSTIKDGPKGEYLPDRLSKEAADYIKQDHDKPFFLFLSHYAVHTPMKAPKETIAKHKDRKGNEYQNHPIYAAMIEHSDNSVANVLQALEDKGISDNTWVILTSDNGGHSGVTQAPDLRGAKGMLYEGGIRVPLLIKAPKQQQQVVIEEPVSTLDFYPTLVALANGKLPTTQPIDGDNILPLLSDKSFDREAIFFHFPAYLEGGKKSKSLWRNSPSSMIRMGDYKLIEYFEYGQLELYNVASDLKETKNLALVEPKVTAKLYQKLLQWRKSTNAPVPTELNPKFSTKYELKRDSYVTWPQVQQQLK